MTSNNMIVLLAFFGGMALIAAGISLVSNARTCKDGQHESTGVRLWWICDRCHVAAPDHTQKFNGEDVLDDEVAATRWTDEDYESEDAIRAWMNEPVGGIGYITPDEYNLYPEEQTEQGTKVRHPTHISDECLNPQCPENGQCGGECLETFWEQR